MPCRSRSAPLLLMAPLLCLTISMAFAQPGLPDPTFGDDGRVVVDYDQVDIAFDVLLEADGAVVTFGSAEPIGNPGLRRGTLTRFDAEGELVLSRSYPASAFGCADVPLQFLSGLALPEGGFLAAGYVQTDCSGARRDFLVYRLAANGDIVDDFDRPVFFGQTANARRIVRQSDGKIVAVGFAATVGNDTTTYDVAIARYNADGSLDADFGTNGEVRFDVASGYDLLYDVAVDSQDRILAAGFSFSAGRSDALLIRLLPDGTLDDTFGGDGIVLRNLHGFNDSARAIALQPDGRIVAAGDSIAADGTTQLFTVTRYLDDGSPDADFADSGVALIDFDADSASATDVHVDPSGRIHVAGWTESGSGGEATRDFAAVVLGTDGSPNTDFGDAGLQTIAFNPGPVDIGLAMDVDYVGSRIAIAGYSGFRDPGELLLRDSAVVRLIGLPGPVIFRDGFE